MKRIITFFVVLAIGFSMAMTGFAVDSPNSKGVVLDGDGKLVGTITPANATEQTTLFNSLPENYKNFIKNNTMKVAASFHITAPSDSKPPYTVTLTVPGLITGQDIVVAHLHKHTGTNECVATGTNIGKEGYDFIRIATKDINYTAGTIKFTVSGFSLFSVLTSNSPIKSPDTGNMDYSILVMALLLIAGAAATVYGKRKLSMFK